MNKIVVFYADVPPRDGPMAKICLFSIFALLSCLNSQTTVQGQRLSQGASDWYMRFHNNYDFVKRNVERPGKFLSIEILMDISIQT